MASGGDLSADGKWVLPANLNQPAQLVLSPVGIGEGRKITDDRIDHICVRFLPDSEAIVFTGCLPEAQLRVYLQPLDRGAPISITPDGIAASMAIPGERAKEISGVTPDDYVDNWSADGKFLFVHRRDEVPSIV